MVHGTVLFSRAPCHYMCCRSTLLLQCAAQVVSLFVALCDLFPAAVIGGNTMRPLSCRYSSGRVRNSFPSNQNGRECCRNALMLAAYNLEVCSLGCCLHSRDLMLPLAFWAATDYLWAAGSSFRPQTRTRVYI